MADLPRGKRRCTPAVNIAELYARFAENMRNGTQHYLGFDHAVTRHELIEAMKESAAPGGG